MQMNQIKKQAEKACIEYCKRTRQAFRPPTTFAMIELAGELILESSKKAVAFAEWKEDVDADDPEGTYSFWDENANFLTFETITDLYKYFIENVYK